MIKLLFWIVLLAVVAFMLGFKRGRPASREERGAASPAPSATPGTPARELESMVSCAECGTHLPAGEALPGRGGQFCSVAHRAAHEARVDAAAAERARDGASGT